MTTAIWAIGAIIVCSVFSALATFLLKKASKTLTANIKKALCNKFIWSGLILYGFATLIALAAYSAGELSVLYPFVALQYIWTALLSKKYLGEKINWLKWSGIGLIIVGVAVVGIGVA